MSRKLILAVVFFAALASFSGCIVHDPGYYPPDTYYYAPSPYYYEPYVPFWFGGYYFRGDIGRGHGWHGGHGGHGGWRR